MQISEQELRAMIRSAIARHAGGDEALAPHVAPPANSGPVLHIHSSHGHSSHGQFLVVGTQDGACVIEPDHRCDHCGYCKSLGH